VTGLRTGASIMAQTLCIQIRATYTLLTTDRSHCVEAFAVLRELAWEANETRRETSYCDLLFFALLSCILFILHYKTLYFMLLHIA